MNKKQKEKEMVQLMVTLYCAKKHNGKNLCPECHELLDYAHRKLTACKVDHKKITCRKCPVHCYNKGMKDKIKIIMRYSGPRVLIYKPFELIKHMLK